MNVSVTGPSIVFEIPIFGGIPVSETIVNSWIVMLVITLLCFWLTRGLTVRNPKRKQVVAEKLVTMVYDMVRDTMGERNMCFAPYIGTLFTFSILGSLSGLTGLRALTGDLNTTLGWALATFFLVQFVAIRHKGFLGWLKGFTEPVVLMTPLNIISEVANPISMAFRHFGNIASGIVITALVYGALAALSQAVIGWIPVIGNIPIFQVGIPAFLSIYFDVFTSFLQAYIISMLTMVFVSSANE